MNVNSNPPEKLGSLQKMSQIRKGQSVSQSGCMVSSLVGMQGILMLASERVSSGVVLMFIPFSTSDGEHLIIDLPPTDHVYIFFAG